MEEERGLLPAVLMTIPPALGGRATLEEAEVEAQAISQNRVQQIVITLDKIKLCLRQPVQVQVRRAQEPGQVAWCQTCTACQPPAPASRCRCRWGGVCRAPTQLRPPPPTRLTYARHSPDRRGTAGGRRRRTIVTSPHAPPHAPPIRPPCSTPHAGVPPHPTPPRPARAPCPNDSARGLFLLQGPPMRLLSDDEAVAHLWSGPLSVAKRVVKVR